MAQEMDGDQSIIFFIGVLFLVAGIGLLFVSTDDRAWERDRKQGRLLMPRGSIFSPYFLFQVPWYRWVAAGIYLMLAAIFITHAFGLWDRILLI